MATCRSQIHVQSSRESLIGADVYATARALIGTDISGEFTCSSPLIGADVLNWRVLSRGAAGHLNPERSRRVRSLLPRSVDALRAIEPPPLGVSRELEAERHSGQLVGRVEERLRRTVDQDVRATDGDRRIVVGRRDVDRDDPVGIEADDEAAQARGLWLVPREARDDSAGECGHPQ